MNNSDTLNILIVDDNPNDILLNKHALKKYYPEAVYTTAEDMESFLKKIEWVNPDVIICDYNLRDCTGLDILLEVKCRMDVPFIFVTGMLNSEIKTAQAILSGASGYVLKDDLNQLGDIVKDVIEKFKYKANKTGELKENLTRLNLYVEKAINKLTSGSDLDEVMQELKKMRQVLLTIEE